MAKIEVSIPATSYKTVIDTEAMNVEIRETFIGVTFISLDGRKMYVSQRDGYFEITYDEEPPIIHKGVFVK